MADNTLKTTVEIAGQLDASLQAAIKQAAESLDLLSKDTLEAASTSQKLAAEIQIQESEMKNLERVYADYILAGQEGSNEAQKLASNIQDLSSKIDIDKNSLKAAFDAAKQLTEGYKENATATEKLNSTISSQEKELQDLKTQYMNLKTSEGSTSKETRDLEMKIINLSAELKKNKTSLSDAQKAADSLDKTLSSAGKSASSASGGFTVLKGALSSLVSSGIQKAAGALKGMISSTIQIGMEFDSAMSEVAAISGATGEEFETLKATAEEYGSSTIFSATESAEALKYMALAGWDTEQSVSALPGILNLAAASGMDLADASDMVTDYLSAFSMEAGQAGYMADVLSYAQQASNTSADQLGEAYGNCAATLSAAGQDIETVTSLLEAMANQGTKGSEAGTQVNKIMSDITSHMEEGALAIGDANIAIADQYGNYRDLTDILTDIETATASMTDTERASALQSVFTINSLSGLNQIFNTGMDVVAGYEEELRASTGTAENMSEVMNDNLAGDIKNLNSAWEGLQKNVYDLFEGVMRKGVQFATSKLVPMAQWFIDHLPQIAVAVSGVAAAMVAAHWSSFVTQIAGVRTTFMKLVPALKAVKGAFLSISWPVLAVVAAVAVLVAAFKHLWDTNEDFKNSITEIWNSIKEKFTEFSDSITGKLNEFGFDFESVVDVIKAVWDGFCNFLAPVFTTAFELISTVVGTAFDVILGLFDFFAGIFTGDWSRVWNGIKKIFTSVFSGIFKVFKTVFNGIKNTVDKVLGWFGTTWENTFGKAYNWVVEKITGAVNFIKSFPAKVKQMLAAIPEFFRSVFESASGKVHEVFDKIKGFFMDLWESIKEKFTNIGTTVTDAITGAVKGAINAVLSGAVSIINGFIHGINGAITFINLIPKVNIPKLNDLEAPVLMAQGGIVTEPVYAMLGEGNDDEAVIPLKQLWSKIDEVIDAVQLPPCVPKEKKDSYVATASRLIGMDSFSLTDMAGAGGTVIYYDFSNFTWSPKVDASNSSPDDFMSKLRAHEAEFFDWLTDFTEAREASMYV